MRPHTPRAYATGKRDVGSDAPTKDYYEGYVYIALFLCKSMLTMFLLLQNFKFMIQYIYLKI